MGNPDETNTDSTDTRTTPPTASAVGGHWPGSLMDRMGMEIIENTAERTVITMPTRGNLQPVGLLHGGASAALAETAASMASTVHASTVCPGGHGHAVGVELSISHVRSTRVGLVTATATALHLGRTSAVHLVQITAADGRLLASARVSNRIIADEGA